MPIALPVVLLARNVARSLILSCADPSPFPSCDDSVRLGPMLHAIDAVLLPLQTLGLSRIQLSALNSLVNPLFLIHLPLIDPRRVDFSVRSSEVAPLVWTVSASS